MRTLSNSDSGRRGKIDWTTIIVIVVLVLIGICVGGFFLIRSIYRGSVLSPFNSTLPELLQTRPGGDQTPTNAPCSKGVMFIDTSDNSFDHLYFDTPEEIKAKTPAEIKTVVFLTWTRNQVGTYGPSNKPAYRNSCKVDIVDRQTKTLLQSNTFVGPTPPATISSRSSSGEGARPNDDVIQFVRRTATK